MSAKIIALIVFVAIFKIECQVPMLGKCGRKFKPMQEFKKLKFMGKWYEVERYYTPRDLITNCVAVTFERFDDGKIYVNNEYKNRLTNRRETMSGKFKLTEGETVGAFRVRYNLLPSFLDFDRLPSLIRTFNATVTVLHTDYDNFAILWTCRDLNQYGHAENSWLLTRQQNATEEVLQTAYGYLDRFGMRNFFYKTRQDGCD